MNDYDVIIVGGGPAGLSAGIYASRSKLKTLVVERESIGGQVSQTNSCENYPGNYDNLSGIELSDKMKKQAEKFGAEVVFDNIVEASIEGDIKVLKSNDKEYHAKALVIATGASPRKLGVKGEKELIGRGVSYCALCDAPFYRGLETYVYGGGDSAIEEALYLAKFSKKVNIIYRGEELKAQKIILDRLNRAENVEVIYNTEILELEGENELKSIKVKNNKTMEVKELDANGEAFGLFVFIGRFPNSGLFEGLELENGYIKTDRNMNTNIKGVFAAGDIRVKSLRQVVTAAAEGAIAGNEAHKYLSR